LVTFAVNLDSDEENLKAFSKSKTVEEDGSVHAFKAAPIRNALTPAPCYHLYPQFSGTALDNAVQPFGAKPIISLSYGNGIIIPKKLSAWVIWRKCALSWQPCQKNGMNFSAQLACQ
jgi:hypothetical protein